MPCTVGSLDGTRQLDTRRDVQLAEMLRRCVSTVFWLTVDRCPESVTREAHEHPLLRRASSRATSAATAWKTTGGTLHPPGAVRLGDGLRYAPAAAPLVDVAPGELFEFTEPHPRRVKDEQRQPIPLGKHPLDGEHVLGGRRRDLRADVARQLHVDRVTKCP
jgi:hypothetical protein